MKSDLNPILFYQKQNRKIQLYSFASLFFSISAPISFAVLTQYNAGLLISGLVGVGSIFLVILFSYLKVENQKRMDHIYTFLKTGMKVRKKQSPNTYEIIQENQRFFYLKDSKDNRKLMVSKDKIRSDFDIHAL